MSIIKLSGAAVLVLPVLLSACGGGDDRPQTASTVSSGSMTQQTATNPDYEANQRIYNRSLRK